MNNITSTLLLIGSLYLIGITLDTIRKFLEKRKQKILCEKLGLKALPRTNPNHQIEAYSGILTIEEVWRMPAGNYVGAIKGTLFDLQKRISSQTRKVFYTGQISDKTGQMGAVFFRNDIKTLEGRKIIIESDPKDRAIRRGRNLYTKAPQIIVFRSAHIAKINKYGQRHYLKKLRPRNIRHQR